MSSSQQRGNPPPYPGSPSRGTSSLRPSSSTSSKQNGREGQSYPTRSSTASSSRSAPGGRETPPPTNRWEAAASGSVESGYRGYNSFEEAPEDHNDPEWLAAKTKNVQMSSLSSTERSLAKLHGAEQLAQSNMMRLHQQSEQLKGIGRRMDTADAHVSMGEAKADHLKSVNRFFMLPAWGSKKAKRKEEEAARLQEEVRMRNEQIYDVNAERGGGCSPHPSSRASSASGARGSSASSSASRFNRHHTTPDGLERDEVEVKIDSNLDQMSRGLERLKLMSQATGQEVESQKQSLDRLRDRTDMSNERLGRINAKLDNIVRKK